MTAEVIPFPKKENTLREVVDSAVLKIAASLAEDLKNYPNVAGVPVQEPKNRQDYLDLCKFFLDPEDYKDILCSIMDKEHYDAMEDKICKVVDAYFSFKK